MQTILIFGYYNHSNIGDELFKQAYQSLFPEYNLVFTDHFTLKNLEEAAAVFIGGGSFLFADPKLTDETYTLLKKQKIFYLGVGGETEIHPIHQELIKIAQLVAVRSPHNIEKIKLLNDKTILIPDLVHILSDRIQRQERQEKSVLILPNLSVVPQNNDPHWKHTSWEYFKSEFSQFLDLLVEDNYTIRFLPMSQSKKVNDTWAAIEIVNKMKHRNSDYLLESYSDDFKELTQVFSQFDHIITQRYHGIILADMMGISCLNIHHHDKLKYVYPTNSSSISYYGLNKDQLLAEFFNNNSNIPIENYIFDSLRDKIIQLI